MLKTKFIMTLLALMLTCQCFAQVVIDWKMLSQLDYVEKFNTEEGVPYYAPKFSDKLTALNGEEVAIKGFMLVIAADENMFILSRNPFSSCFFCGSGGPESVVELHVKPGHPTFKMDQVVTMKGILKLNADDFDHFNYILEEAEVLAK